MKNKAKEPIKVRYIGIANCFAWQLAKAVELKLTAIEIACLEELYVPHALAGVMAQNGNCCKFCNSSTRRFS